MSVGTKKEQTWTICGPKANNCWECLILLVAVLFIGEEWLSLLTLLKSDLLRQFCTEKEQRQKGKVTKIWKSIKHFDLTPLY